MKKLFFVFLFLGSMCTAWSQTIDTINYVPQNYFQSSAWTSDTATLNRTYYLSRHYGVHHEEIAKACYTEQPIRVYGVAAAWIIMTVDYRQPTPEQLLNGYEDTALAHVYEYYKILTRDEKGQFDLLAQVPVYATTTPVAYVRFMHGDTWHFGPRRILEAYFDDPVTVSDTFYVGCTEYMGEIFHDSTGHQMRRHRTMDYNAVSLYGMWQEDFPEEDKDYVFERSYYYDWTPYNTRINYFLFPIFNPDEELEGVEKPRGLGRYVTVSPNPASDRARVVSSFPLKRIEVYDLSGRQVHTQQASGVSAWIDVKGWPSGTYMVNIFTTMGDTTRKLLVP